MSTEKMVANLLFGMESERVGRTISTRVEKLGFAVCAFSNDFSNSKQPGYQVQISSVG